MIEPTRMHLCFSVTWQQDSNNSCKNPGQLFEFTQSVSTSNPLVYDNFNISNLRTSKFIPRRFTLEQQTKFKFIILQRQIKTWPIPKVQIYKVRIEIISEIDIRNQNIKGFLTCKIHLYPISWFSVKKSTGLKIKIMKLWGKTNLTGDKLLLQDFNLLLSLQKALPLFLSSSKLKRSPSSGLQSLFIYVTLNSNCRLISFFLGLRVFF